MANRVWFHFLLVCTPPLLYESLLLNLQKDHLNSNPLNMFLRPLYSSQVYISNRCYKKSPCVGVFVVLNSGLKAPDSAHNWKGGVGACKEERGKWLFRERWPPVRLPKHQRQLRTQKKFLTRHKTFVSYFLLFCENLCKLFQASLRDRKTLHLLLFLKTLLQLRVSQIGVVQVLRGPPTRRPSPPSGDRPPAQLGPDPPLLEEQPAKASVSPWRVPVV